RLVELTPDKNPAQDDPPKQTPVREMPDLPADLPANVRASALGSMIGGSNVFILFDTSNYMYRGFVFAQDAIADFIRSLDSSDRLAFYSYSRNLSRAALLTPDRSLVLRGVRATVAGDDAALYDALLMCLKDG